MTPEEQPVSVREFERTHAELREDMAQLRQENSDDHASVVTRLEQLEKKIENGFGELGKVVTWPQLATLLLVLCAVGGFAFLIVDHA